MVERIYQYRIDKEGGLWIEGTQLTDPMVLKYFHRKMEALPDGRFFVDCMGEKNIIRAEDVPYVVQSIEVRPDGIELIFPGDYREALDPSTLFVGDHHVLYCKVRDGQFTARFKRHPYMELAHHIEGGAGQGYFLKWQGEKFPIHGQVE